jgi:hypothetical protein
MLDSISEISIRRFRSYAHKKQNSIHTYYGDNVIPEWTI